MKLKEYLQEYGTANTKFAKKIGVSEHTIKNFVHELTEPRLHTAVLIEEITKGQVTCRDLVLVDPFTGISKKEKKGKKRTNRNKNS